MLERLMQPPGAGRSAGEGEAAALRSLHAELARDLEWLLNTKRWLEAPLDAFPEARESLLSFGLPELASYSGRSAGDGVELGRVLEEAIRRFEPRLRAHSVRVTPVPGKPLEGFRLCLRIDALVQAAPGPLPVSFDTEVDLEASRVRVRSSP